MEEQKSLITKFKNITLSLQRIIECPICLDTLKIPFKLCSNGHGVCSSCCNELKKCSTCEAPFTMENPTCLRNLLEVLPRMCQFSDIGCEEIMEQGSDHEEFCGYRLINCPRCLGKVSLIKLLDHYKTDHPESFVFEAPTEYILWPDFNPKESCKDYMLIKFFNNTFWLSMTNDSKKKYLKFTFIATPNGKLNNNYFARVELKNGDFVYSYTIKASVSRSLEINKERTNKDDDVSDDLDSEKYQMKIPQSVLHKFISLEGALEFHVYFFEETK